MKKQFLMNLLQMLGLEENYNWGKYKIEINGKTYTSCEDIPIEILRSFPDLHNFKVETTQNIKELYSFIIFRLVDKLQHEYERQELHLTQQKIPDIILDEYFLDLFVDFLRAQTLAHVYNDLETKILNALRKENGQIQQIYKTKSPLREHNTKIRKNFSYDADAKWDRVVKRSSQI